MKLELELSDDNVDQIVIAALRRTSDAVNDEKWRDLYPDHAELAAACKTMLDYYSGNNLEK